MATTPSTRGRKRGTYQTAVAAVLRLATSGRAVSMMAVADWAGKPSRSPVPPPVLRLLSRAAFCYSVLASSAWRASCAASLTGKYNPSPSLKRPELLLRPLFCYLEKIREQTGSLLRPEAISLATRTCASRSPGRGQGIVEFGGKRPLGGPLLLAREVHLHP